MIVLLPILVLVHLLYDFHWQGPFIAEMKGKSWFLLGVHSLTWALCLWVTLYLWRGGVADYWILAFWAGTHFS